ncbi:MAG TPA: hypothetical protein VFY18_14575 [Candidatus Limnocylindrales bacterium]|nr:hypothetical protein [Candidatus Limnocylindrales bacterium]
MSSASEKLEPLLERGTLLFVTAGPIRADEYEWYQLTPFVALAPTGWVAAAAHDGTPWLAPASLACPAPPIDVRNVPDPFGLGGLVCYGGREIQITGDVTCELADLAPVFAGPEWLRTDRHCLFDVNGQAIEFFDGGIGGLGLPTHGRGVVTGHFDDAEAPTCTWAGEAPAPDLAWVVVSCRASFVATELN